MPAPVAATSLPRRRPAARRGRPSRHRTRHAPRRREGEALSAWKEAHNKSYKQTRGRIEPLFARMKTWKILRDCRLKGDSVYHAMLGIAPLHSLAPRRIDERSRTETDRPSIGHKIITGQAATRAVPLWASG